MSNQTNNDQYQLYQQLYRNYQQLEDEKNKLQHIENETQILFEKINTSLMSNISKSNLIEYLLKQLVNNMKIDVKINFLKFFLLFCKNKLKENKLKESEEYNTYLLNIVDLLNFDIKKILTNFFRKKYF
jgi:hypothetical protein